MQSHLKDVDEENKINEEAESKQDVDESPKTDQTIHNELDKTGIFLEKFS